MVMPRNDPTLPQVWLDAASAFLRHLPSRGLVREQVAYGLSVLYDLGYVMHPDEHDRICQDYADRLRTCERAADELVRQLHGGEDL